MLTADGRIARTRTRQTCGEMPEMPSAEKGLPGLLPDAGFTLPDPGQLSLGSANRRHGPLTSLVAFRPHGFGGLGGAGDLRSQLAAGPGGLLTSAAGLSFGGFPAAISGLRRFQRREHVLFGLGGTRLGGDRPRLGTAPGRFGLRQPRGYHFRIQRRDLPARQRDHRPCLPDQRLQRAERIRGLPR